MRAIADDCRCLPMFAGSCVRLPMIADCCAPGIGYNYGARSECGVEPVPLDAGPQRRPRGERGRMRVEAHDESLASLSAVRMPGIFLSIEQGGAPMVALEYVARSARRHDTVMAWAFRRALGIRGRMRREPGGSLGTQLEMRRYAGLAECMANRGR